VWPFWDPQSAVFYLDSRNRVRELNLEILPSIDGTALAIPRLYGPRFLELTEKPDDLTFPPTLNLTLSFIHGCNSAKGC